jgi:hypothetical protein
MLQKLMFGGRSELIFTLLILSHITASATIFTETRSWESFNIELDHPSVVKIVNYDSWKGFENVLGMATINPISSKWGSVTLDVDRIKEFNINVEMVALHELGHLYRLGHTNESIYNYEQFGDGCAKHIMIPVGCSFSAGDHCWERHKDFYIRQIEDWIVNCEEIVECNRIKTIW